MRVATNEDREHILAYLRSDVKDCIYLYIDIMNYGVSSENMKVWLKEEDDGISLVVMKYYDSFQVYSHKNSCDMTPVASLLQKHPVAMISGRSDLIKLLEKECTGYKATYGTVFVMDRYRKMPKQEEVLLAKEDDAREIAKLICSDEEIGGHYTVDTLTEQLAERIRTKTGRSYIIRKEGVVVAHSATYAEAEGIAVVGGTIIREDCRTGNYYMLLSNYMLERLAGEGKTAYTFSVSDKMIKYHGMLHTKCGEYGKLVREKDTV